MIRNLSMTFFYHLVAAEGVNYVVAYRPFVVQTIHEIDARRARCCEAGYRITCRVAVPVLEVLEKEYSGDVCPNEW